MDIGEGFGNILRFRNRFIGKGRKECPIAKMIRGLE
jgi:hypothetical protein